MILKLNPEFLLTRKVDTPSNVDASASIAHSLREVAAALPPQRVSAVGSFNQGASGAFLGVVSPLCLVPSPNATAVTTPRP
jgi:hypothetical protein